jgi:hypothetical protein
MNVSYREQAYILLSLSMHALRWNGVVTKRFESASSHSELTYTRSFAEIIIWTVNFV